MINGKQNHRPAPVRRLSAAERRNDVIRVFRDEQWAVNLEMIERYKIVSKNGVLTGIGHPAVSRSVFRPLPALTESRPEINL